MPLCNAKNHRWNCTCGFGGARGGASAKRANLNAPDLFVLPKVPRRYTKPNQRCSFCDTPVFFRHLANGGKVYFDEPGFPWTKHACLDQASTSYLGIVDPLSGNWPQVTEISADVVGHSVVRLSGRLSDTDWKVFVSMVAFGDVSTSPAYLRDSFIQAHASFDGKFDLAVLTPDLRRKLVTAYPTAGEVTLEDKSKAGLFPRSRRGTPPSASPHLKS